MTFDETIHQLEASGTEQYRKTYARHGVGENQYGVSYSVLGALVKKIKVDHDLAVQLWETGNHDARILATMIADPNAFKFADLKKWSKDLSNYVITDAFARMVSGTPHIGKAIEEWTGSSNEWLGSAGYSLLSYLAKLDTELPDSFFEEHLATIQKEIHTRKNRTRFSMNGALIGIGLRNENLKAKAIAAAKVIGTVEVDHGETNCETPDAIAYIAKAGERKKPAAKKKK